MKRVVFSTSVILALVSAALLWGHGGGLDSQGGHTNRKTGEYHFHRTPAKSVAPPTVQRAPPEVVSPPVERSASGAGVGLEYPVEDFSGDVPSPVLRVVDGDTVEIQHNGTPAKVRLIGVDTPETVHPQKPIEAYGKAAGEFTRNLLLGEEVWLQFDTDRTDKYGRTLAYLYRSPDGLFVNLEIVRQGYGHAYTAAPFRHMELFRSYERRAREAGKGLWRTTTVEATGSPERELSPVIRAVPTVGEEVTVYITRTGKKYHQAGCGFLSKSQTPISLKDAKAQGYGACSVCRPPL